MKKSGRKKPFLDAGARAPLVLWAVACADRVLPLFERIKPDDDRPRRALETGKAWVREGVKFGEIRAAALAAHAAAREAGDPAAIAAARAAGQAVATAHAARHARGAAWYALKVVADPQAERAWQRRRLPKGLDPDQLAAAGFGNPVLKTPPWKKPRSLAEIRRDVFSCDARLKPFAQQPIDITDPAWIAKFAGRDPLKEAGVKRKAQALIAEILDRYLKGPESVREKLRRIFRDFGSFAWAAYPAEALTSPAGIKAHLLLLSVRDQGNDPRDALVAMDRLAALAVEHDVKFRPLASEIAEISSREDRYGMGSLKDMLLRRFPEESGEPPPPKEIDFRPARGRRFQGSRSRGPRRG